MALIPNVLIVKGSHRWIWREGWTPLPQPSLRCSKLHPLCPTRRHLLKLSPPVQIPLICDGTHQVTAPLGFGWVVWGVTVVIVAGPKSAQPMATSYQVSFSEKWAIMASKDGPICAATSVSVPDLPTPGGTYNFKYVSMCVWFQCLCTSSPPAIQT
jgi:hypothetical protein